MKIEILDGAKDDLIAGFHFYEEQSPGRGSYFLDSLFGHRLANACNAANSLLNYLFVILSGAKRSRKIPNSPWCVGIPRQARDDRVEICMGFSTVS